MENQHDAEVWRSMPMMAGGISESSLWSHIPTREAIHEKICNTIPSKETMIHGIQAVPGAFVAAPGAIIGIFGQCFSRTRRVQFDQDQKRSLLSNLYNDDARFNIRDAEVERAALELRRRIQKVEYEKHRRAEVEEVLGLHNKVKNSQDKKHPPPSDSNANPAEELEFNQTTALNAADIRKMSVDELLSIDRLESCLSESSSTAASSLEGGRLRKWLAEIDKNKSMEYIAYGSAFEKQGFHSLKDIEQLDEDEIDKALTEIGVSKFAHRARIRKAILRLNNIP
jgi:hypothetical protein